MAERPDLPRIMPRKRGIFSNDGAIDGSNIAGAATGAAMFVTKRFSFWGLIAAPVAGMLVGGIIGRGKENREQVEGRVVKDPTFVNRGLYSGLALGVATLPFFGLFAVPVGLVGGGIGSIVRRNEMKADLRQAEWIQKTEAQQIQNALRLREMGGYKNSVSPQEAAALEARQRMGGQGVGHADSVMAARLAENPAARN